MGKAEAATIGTALLLLIAAAGVLLLVANGIGKEAYRYMWKETPNAACGADEMTRKRRETLRRARNEGDTVGIMLRSASAVPALPAGAMPENARQGNVGGSFLFRSSYSHLRAILLPQSSKACIDMAARLIFVAQPQKIVPKRKKITHICTAIKEAGAKRRKFAVAGNKNLHEPQKIVLERQKIKHI